MTLVLDASVTMAWCFEDEFSDFAQGVLERVVADGAVAPAVWALEVANVLLVAERGMRLSLAKVESSIDLLKALSIEVEVPSHLQVSGEVLALGRSQNLTVYDASYFELARRERLPLATLDERLREAARRVGVAVLE